MKQKYIKLIQTLTVSTIIGLSVGCAGTKPTDLYDSLAVESIPQGATVYVKRLDSDFTTFEMESNIGSRVDNSYFSDMKAGADKTDTLLSMEEGFDSGSVEVFTAETPARFSLQRKGRYAVAIAKEGYVTQTQIVEDKLTGGEVVGNVAKTAGTAAGSLVLGILTGGLGLLALPAAAVVKGKNVSSGKNKELTPNPLSVVLEDFE